MFVQKATNTAWSMVTTQPPMIAMCPSATVATLDPAIHERREYRWDEHVTDNVPLVYLRPIFYTCYGASQPEQRALVIHEISHKDCKTSVSTHRTYKADGAIFEGCTNVDDDDDDL